MHFCFHYFVFLKFVRNNRDHFERSQMKFELGSVSNTNCHFKIKFSFASVDLCLALQVISAAIIRQEEFLVHYDYRCYGRKWTCIRKGIKSSFVFKKMNFYLTNNCDDILMVITSTGP